MNMRHAQADPHLPDHECVSELYPVFPIPMHQNWGARGACIDKKMGKMGLGFSHFSANFFHFFSYFLGEAETIFFQFFPISGQRPEMGLYQANRIFGFSWARHWTLQKKPFARIDTEYMTGQRFHGTMDMIPACPW